MAHPDGKIVSPGAFIQAAEHFGLMPQVDRWVVQRVLDVLHARPDMKIFVNLSGSSLSDAPLLEYIEKRVREAKLAAGRLVFEITETAAVTDLQHAQQWMVRLSELGCHFALDDFGIAFSSFAYLRELPVHYVKLDGTFVKNLDRDPCDRAMVQALNTVAHSLGKKVIAEWVENKAVADVLREIGTEFGQGYYWGQPKPEPAVPALRTESAAAA
jgi:EAL domain-containing protein (putative c-di-GMP-specific phosphodiesterase class I)